MALRTILNKRDEILYKKCRPVDKFDSKLHTLLDDMKETLYNADGAGLAAPQVGILRRVCVMDVGEGYIELINPEIIKTSGEQTGIEGCLSCPGEWGYVTRPMNVTFKAQDRFGNWYEKSVEGLFARCVMHECDHLDGKIFLDLVTRWVDPEELEDK